MLQVMCCLQNSTINWTEADLTSMRSCDIPLTSGQFDKNCVSYEPLKFELYKSKI